MYLPDTTTYSEFRENLAGHIKRLKKARQPTVVTQNGKNAAVVMSPDAYERLLAEAEESRSIEAIRRAQQEIRDGKGRPAAEVFAELKAKYARRTKAQAQIDRFSVSSAVVMPSLPKFSVIVSQQALRDIDAIAQYIRADSPDHAESMVEEFRAAIAELEYLPSRFVAALESPKTLGDLRQRVVKSYRIIYEIRGREVHVLTVRHAARRPMDL